MWLEYTIYDLASTHKIWQFEKYCNNFPEPMAVLGDLQLVYEI